MTRPTPRQQQSSQETEEAAVPPAPSAGATGTTGTTGASAAPSSPPASAPPRASYEASYSRGDLEEAATALGVHPWAVAGIFFSKHTERMTMAEFNAALKEWRTPPPRGQRQQPARHRMPSVPSPQRGGGAQGFFGSPGPREQLGGF